MEFSESSRKLFFKRFIKVFSGLVAFISFPSILKSNYFNKNKVKISAEPKAVERKKPGIKNKV